MKKIKTLALIIVIVCLILIIVSTISKNYNERNFVIPSEYSGSLLEEENNAVIKENLQAIASGGEENSVYFADKIMCPPKNMTYEPISYQDEYAIPLEGKKTSSYGFRLHPISENPDFHSGIDIAADKNTPIHAFDDGVVIASGNSQSLGKYLQIEHEDNTVTVYGHCNKLLKDEGDKVKQGEVIAKVGSTGMSTGPHLHFSIKRGDIYYNPELIFD